MSIPAALTGMVLIWATTPLAIQWSSHEVGAMFSLTSRLGLGMVLCLILLLVLRIPVKWHREACLTYLISGLGLYAAMTSVYSGAQYISSGLISVIYGLLPTITFLCATLVLREPLWQVQKLAGALLGLAGLTVIFNPQDSFSGTTLLGGLFVVVSVVCHSLSMVGIQRIAAKLNPVLLTTGSLMVAVPLCFITWWWFDGVVPETISDKSVVSILYLSIVGSVLGFALFFYVIKHVSAGSIAALTLVSPVLALSLGHWLNGEALSTEILLGGGLILSGLAMHHWGGRLWYALRSVESEG